MSFNGYVVQYYSNDTRQVEEDSYLTEESVHTRGFIRLPSVEEFIEGLYTIFGDTVLTVSDKDGNILYRNPEEVEDEDGHVVHSVKPVVDDRIRAAMGTISITVADVLDILATKNPIEALASRLLDGSPAGITQAHMIFTSVGMSHDAATSKVASLMEMTK